MPEQGASFIPKSGVRTVKRTRGTRRIYLLAYVSYIVFFSTLFVVVGVYLYGATVTRSLDSLKSQLTVERQRFDVSDIEDVRLLDRRLKLAERTLDESAAPSRLFSDIEAIVASNVYFSSMTYKQLPNRQFEVELVGRADNFNQVINQHDLLKNSTLLRDATVKSYDYSLANDEDKDGQATLTFTFADTRDLSLIAYKPSETESTVILNQLDNTESASTTEPVLNLGGASSSSTPTTVVVGGARAATSSDADNQSQ